MIPDQVQAKAREIADASEGLPAYIYDLPSLRRHAAGIREALSGSGVEVFYTAKANPEPAMLKALEPYVAGFEVASGGELSHLRDELPQARIAFGGPGKTDAELALALRSGVERIHLESPYELARLARISNGRTVSVLLRANLALGVRGAALAMSGPFGMDDDGLRACLPILAENPWIEARGVHTHLASGLDAAAMLQLGEQILDWARPWLRANLPQVARPEVVLGGGMGVDYAHPASRFDWNAYGKGLTALADDDVRLRIEPGRSVTVYDGYYVTDVLDLKWNHGHAYAILRGGTHHLRTPATKGHSHPFTIIHRPTSEPSPTAEADRSRRSAADRRSLTTDAATLVGQLCTPKDVLARDVPVADVRVGDLIAFEMAGAYAWNISHHDFLMHPKPTFHLLTTSKPV